MKRYYLIGQHLGHSCSPDIHRAFGRYEYELWELAPDALDAFLRAGDFAGLNVTMPYKQAVLPALDRLDPAAAAIGAVNTVVNRDGILWGYNTDYGGLRACLERLLPAQAGGRPLLAGKAVLILGTGGTSRTAAAVCKALGAERIQKLSRTGKDGALRYSDLPDCGADAALLINCSPAGMWPEPERCPLDPAALPALEAVFDCVYNPLRTRLVLAARALGIPAAGGLEMLVRQAALACALFTQRPVSEEELSAVHAALLRQRENLVLIGMPGAGKTTLGRLLARKTGMEWIDLDEALVRRCGTSIPELFARFGERGFRDRESALVRELARTGGRIIAAGGGTVLRAENCIALKQNGRLILLDRPPDALRPSPERPLGDTAEKLAALYQARSPIYAAAADLTIPNRGSPEEAADAILEAVQRG